METFVAVTILIIAVTGPLSIFSRSISDGNFSANRVTAFYLAQEGLELVINKRENNVRGSGDWFDGFDVCSGGCEIELEGTIKIRSCNIDADNGCRLYLTDDGVYTYDSSGNSPTIFQRSVTITPSSDPDIDEAVVKSELRWTNKNNLQELFLTTFIYDTKQ